MELILQVDFEIDKKTLPEYAKMITVGSKIILSQKIYTENKMNSTRLEFERIRDFFENYNNYYIIKNEIKFIKEIIKYYKNKKFFKYNKIAKYLNNKITTEYKDLIVRINGYTIFTQPERFVAKPVELERTKNILKLFIKEKTKENLRRKLIE